MINLKSMFGKIQVWFIEHRRELLLLLLAFLIGSISFGLGYIIRGNSSHAPIIIEKK